MKFISKLQANKGLRAMLNIGAKGREQTDVSRPHCLGHRAADRAEYRQAAGAFEKVDYSRELVRLQT